MLGALEVLILFSDERFRRKEKLDLRAAAAWKSPFAAGAADRSSEPSLVRGILEDVGLGVAVAILIRWDAPVISADDKQLARVISAGEKGEQQRSRRLG
jgi:hypothetical protein